MSIQNLTKKPKCECGAVLGTGAALIVNGWWRCPDCVYRDEHPDIEIPERASRRALPLQKETLFDG